jgi:hypothetical protein
MLWWLYKNKEKHVRNVSAEKGISPILVFRQMCLNLLWPKLQDTVCLKVLTMWQFHGS